MKSSVFADLGDSQDVMVHVLNPIFKRLRQVNFCGLQASLIHILSYSPARTAE